MPNSAVCYGLSKLQARKLVYDYAVSIGKTLPENWRINNVTSKDWVRGFLSRNSQLSLGTPEARHVPPLSTNIGEFFNNLKNVFERYKFGPESIYNVDKTVLTTVQRTQKLITTKGTKQVGQATSAERTLEIVYQHSLYFHV